MNIRCHVCSCREYENVPYRCRNCGRYICTLCWRAGKYICSLCNNKVIHTKEDVRNFMNFTATRDEVLSMACLAISASTPRGLGELQYRKQDDDPNPVEVARYFEKDGLYLDYFRGRMVKFHVHSLGPELWQCLDVINPDYQSWSVVYPSYEALLKKVRDGSNQASNPQV